MLFKQPLLKSQQDSPKAVDNPPAGGKFTILKKFLSFIKKLILSLDFTFIDNLIKFIEGIGIAAFILIFIVFLQYLYIPIFYKTEVIYIVKPNINYELLKQVEEKLLIQKEISDDNIIEYNDPFIK